MKPSELAGDVRGLVDRLGLTDTVEVVVVWPTTETQDEADRRARTEWRVELRPREVRS